MCARRSKYASDFVFTSRHRYLLSWLRAATWHVPTITFHSPACQCHFSSPSSGGCAFPILLVYSISFLTRSHLPSFFPRTRPLFRSCLLALYHQLFTGVPLVLLAFLNQLCLSRPSWLRMLCPYSHSRRKDSSTTLEPTANEITHTSRPLQCHGGLSATSWPVACQASSTYSGSQVLS